MERNENLFGGSWTEEKLAIVKKYLQAYATALKRQKFRKIYIDAFAGTGTRRVKKDMSQPLDLFEKDPDVTEFLTGSTINALEVNPKFDEYYFIEQDSNKLELLKQTTQNYQHKAIIHYVSDDSNRFLKTLCDKIDWERNRAVLFLDPFGMELDWSTVEVIASKHAIDVWLLFPIQSVNRLLPNDGVLPDAWKDTLNKFFGNAEWEKEFYTKTQQDTLFGITEKTEKVANWDKLGNYIQSRLSECFPAVAKNPKLLRNGLNSPIFLLCFAIGNPSQKAIDLGLRLAEHILEG